MSDASYTSISFAGDASRRAEAIAGVDRGLKLHGNFGPYGDLTCGLGPILRDGKVAIVDGPGHYRVSIAPRSGGGHDFSFLVDKASGLISGLVVGSVLPPPELPP